MPEDPVARCQSEFVDQWGALGSAWGINRSMAQIHARLLIAPESMSTDALIEELGISRGNANTNLRELVGWGLVRTVVVRGERRQYFEAEKSVWRIFCTIARERKRRELEPALAMLRGLHDRTRSLRTRDGKALHSQIGALADFVETVTGIIDRVVSRSESQVVPSLLRLFR
jgi:DNA-binding transcriptional regulator GbsR (MarR family)